MHRRGLGPERTIDVHVYPLRNVVCRIVDVEDNVSVCSDEFEEGGVDGRHP